jgi:ABC-2 type transport system ATP-binding protein
VSSLGAEHVVEFALDHGASVPSAELRALPGVRDVRAANGTTSLHASELHVLMPALLAEIERRGLRLSLFTTHQATLEDVFVAHTGRHLRDE